MTNWLEDLRRISKKRERLVLGLMSGTSADSIDVAICRISGKTPKVKLVRFDCFPYQPKTRAQILAALSLNTAQLSELNVIIAKEFFNAAKRALRKSGLSFSKVDLIGTHGQTVYHHSGEAKQVSSTLQLGDGDVIAELSGVTVISDFRMRDIAAGGEGAPLTPYADFVLFGGDPARAVLNLGGIANITLLARRSDRVLGFDIGPANAPIDRLVRIFSKGRLNFDPHGRIAAKGALNQRVLDRLIAKDKFLNKKYPKSSGTEMYGDKFVAQLIKLNRGKVNQDLIRTATEFSAYCVSHHLQQFPKIKELVISGGGSRNTFLLKRISSLCRQVRVIASDQLGVPVDAREAVAFAIFADELLRARPVSIRAVTGASRATLLGKISPKF